MTLEQLKVIITADASGFNKEMGKVSKSLSGLNAMALENSSNINKAFSGMKRALSTTAIIAGFSALGKKAVETASDLVEVQNVVDTAFGSMNKEVDRFAKSSMTQFGLSSLAAKKYSSTLMAMGNSMGIKPEWAKTMAIQLTGLSSDLASFYNTDVETAFNALQGIYTGTTRALRQYGVVLSDVELEQYAASKGITKNTESMTGAELATLRYNYVLEHTTQAQNDFAKTNLTWANSLKVVSNQFIELAGVLGTILKSVLAPFVTMLQVILSYAIGAAKALASLFGVSLDFSTKNLEEVPGVFGDAADATNAANGAAKKYQKTLAKFDEINNLKKENDSGGSGSIGAIGGGGFDVGKYFDISDKTDGFKFHFNEWLLSVNKWLEEYKSKIESLGTILGTKFNKLVNYIDFPLLGATIIKGLNEAFTSVNNFFNSADFVNFGKRIGQMINSGLEELDPLAWGQILVNKLNMLFQTAYGFVTELDWALLGQKIQDTIRAVFDKIDFESISGTFITGLNGLITVVSQWTDTFPIEEIVSKVWKAISDILSNVDWEGLGESLNKLVMQLFKALQNIDFSEVTKAISQFLEGLDIVGLSIEWFKTKSQLIFEGLAGLLSTPEGWKLVLLSILGSIGSLFGKLGKGLVPIITVALGANFKTIAGKVAKAFNIALTGVGEGWWKNADVFNVFFNNLKEQFKGVAQVISSFAPLIKFISGIGAVIGGVTATITGFLAQWQNGFDAAKAVLTAFGVALAAFGAILLGAPALVTGVVAGITFVVGELVIVIKDNWDSIVAWTTNLWEQVKQLFANLVDWIKQCGQNIKDGWNNLKDSLSNTCTNIWNFMTNTWANISTTVSNFATRAKEGAINAFNNLKSGASNIFQQLVGIIKRPINAIIGLINGLTRGIANGINGAADILNQFRVDVPSWVPYIGGNSFGFNLGHVSIPSIPMLATGGIASSPTLAMVGEYSNANTNPEVIAPLDKLSGMLRTDETNSLLRELISVVDSKEFKAYISKNEVGRSAVDYINGQSRITGVSPLKGAY